MQKIVSFSVVILCLCLYKNADAGLLINEIACATSGDDWVELTYTSDINDSMEISGLYVTMYYGTNENLSSDPVTIYSFDRPETPYDDRFIVVHLTAPGIPDETDITGDTNENGYIDVYCNNYSNSLWNSDCVAAIDDDDDPSNGGIVDFAAYSNMDGSLNSTIESYVVYAQNAGQWEPGTAADTMIFTGKDGLESFMSISRINAPDTGTKTDFAITRFMTPGRDNIFNESVSGGGNIFTLMKAKIIVTPDDIIRKRKDIGLFIYHPCSVRFRIFSSIGLLLYESPLYENILPGNISLQWNINVRRNRKTGTGLYIAQIEATSRELKKSQSNRVFMIVSRYK